MRYSIKLKIFLTISFLIIFNIALSTIINSLFLNKYYVYKKESALKQNFILINREYEGSPEQITLEIEKLERNEGIHITILDKELNIKYVSFGRTAQFRRSMPERKSQLNDRNSPEFTIKSRIQQLNDSKFFIETNKDERLNSYFIRLLGLLSNGDYILLSSPVSSIQESVDIANKFFIFSGLLTLAAGSILILLITGKLTKPILELNKITQRMSMLDFSKRYSVKTNDEIGQLGESINSLSEQLEKSIMELLSANKKLKDDIERERKIDEMRKEFIYNVSHELKTPIALIQGYAEGLKFNVTEEQEDKDFYCDVIIDESFKMNRLVKQLLELSQLESGILELDKTNFDILRLIEHVVKKNEILLKERNISINICGEKDLDVNADYERIEQVMINYLSNAINHVNEDKIIRICAERKEQKARISIFNSGQHIPEDSLDRIWTSFYKVDKARTRAYGGTGLGLSIVRAIQEAHQNGYGVSNVDGGVEFWFDLDV